MLKITMLGLALVAFALSGAVPAVSTEDALANEITCSGDHTQMVSPSDMNVCVFKQSVLKLQMRGFEFVGKPFDMFPVKVSSGSTDFEFIEDSLSTGTVITMSNLPNIGETAILNITYTNDVFMNITDDTLAASPAFVFEVGWVVPITFKVVDNGGNEPTLITSPHVSDINRYTEFIRLDYGESHTYLIEVRAVTEGNTWVAGLGYGGSDSSIYLHLDAEETMLSSDHKARYPEQYVPIDSTPFVRTPIPPRYDDRDLKDMPDYEPPSRETLAGFFEAYFAGNDTKENIGSAMTFVQEIGIHLNYTLSDLRTILGSAGYTNEEIESEWSSRASTQPPP